MPFENLEAKIVLKDEFSAAFDKLEGRLDKLEGKLDKPSKSMSGFSLATTAAMGVVAGGVTLAANKILEFSSTAVSAFEEVTSESIAMRSELEQATLVFSKLVGGGQAATAFLGELRGEAARLGVSFADASRFAKSLLPDTKSFEQFYEVLRLAAVGAKDAKVPLEELIFSFNELAAGDLVSIRDRLDLPRDVVQRIKDAGAATGDYLTPAVEELNALFEKRGINSIEDFANSYEGMAGRLGALSDELKLEFGESPFTIWKSVLEEVVGYLEDNKQGLLDLANSAGDTVATMIELGKTFGGTLVDTVGLVDGLAEKLLGLEESSPFEKLNSALSTANQLIIYQTASLAGLAKFFSEGVAQAIDVATNSTERMFAGFQSGFDALKSGGNPLEAFYEGVASIERKSIDLNAVVQAGQKAFRDTMLELVAATQDAGDETNAFELKIAAANKQWQQLADSVSSGGADMASALEDFTEKAGKLNEQYIKKASELEYDHVQQVKRLNAEMTQAVIEAAAEAAAARGKSAQDLAAGLASIERDLARDRAEAERKFNEDADRLRQERRDAERDFNRDIRDINQGLAEDLEALHYDAEQDKAKITQDFAAKRLQIEQSFADKRARVDDEYSGEYENADAFRRKILDLNRQEQLKLLDEQEAAEGAALDSQEQQAITALETRVQREADILNREAEQKRLRLQEEFNDRLEALTRERDLLAQHLAEEQARRDEDAALARQKLQEKNAEELARIDEQEAQKVARAQEAITRENQQYQDRLAELRRHHAIERAEIAEQFRAIEAERQASYARQLVAAMRFQEQMLQIQGLYGGGGGGGGGAAGGTRGYGSAGDTINLNVNNYGAPGGYAGATQTARSVLDALKGR